MVQFQNAFQSGQQFALEQDRRQQVLRLDAAQDVRAEAAARAKAEQARLDEERREVEARRAAAKESRNILEFEAKQTADAQDLEFEAAQEARDALQFGPAEAAKRTRERQLEADAKRKALQGAQDLEFGVTGEARKVAEETREQTEFEGEQTAEDEDQAREAARNLFNLFGAGLAAGMSNEVIEERARQIFGNLGIPEEAFENAFQILGEGPEAVDLAIAALTERGSGERRVIQEFQVTEDGVTGIRRVFDRGPAEFFPGITKDSVEATKRARDQTGTRLRIQERQVAVAENKIDPEAANRLAGTKKAGELNAVNVSDGLVTARLAVADVENTTRALELIDEGIISGAAGSVRQGASRYFAGILGLNDETIPNTDEFFARMGIEVARQIKAFGAGTGLSDADREFAASIVGANKALDTEAIRRLVTMRRGIAQQTIVNYNRDRDAFVEGSERLSSAFPRIVDPSLVEGTSDSSQRINDLVKKHRTKGG